MNLYKAFKKTVIEFPHNNCVTDHNKSLTYKDLLNKIDEYSSYLNENIEKETCVILYLPKSIDLIAWQLAINANNMAFLTLEYDEKSRLESSINQCLPSLLISENNNKLVLTQFDNYKKYTNCSYIVFSSGSTGNPKKILLKDIPLIDVVLEQAKITKMDSSKTSLWLLNPAFDASLSDIYMTLLSGGHLVISSLKPVEIKKIQKLIDIYKITHTDIPPVTFKVWLKYFQNNKTTIEHIIFGGELANEALCNQLLEFVSLYNAYGPTETTICTSLTPISHHWTSNNIGQPLSNVFYKIIDNELHIGGEHCAIGYDNPLLDKKFYTENNIKWFISGDIVKFENNNYFYLGRKDRQFKHNGQLICPEEIENIALMSGAHQAKVIYTDNKITLKYSGQLNKKNLIENMPTWMVPHIFEETVLSINQNWKTII